MADPLLVDQEGHAEPLIGNEAIVRGALEAGVAFACGYPGTPSSEVTDSFARISKKLGLTFEYSINEKVALEMAFAASLAGARSICAMKHLGLMYAGDPLSTMPYVGTTGGMVIVSAGDPTCRTSPNEQDQRHLASMLFLPMLDPPTPAAAHAMARFAFELSEQCQLPVILRPTTRVCHSRGVVRYGKLQPPRVTGFVRDPRRLVPIPVNARQLRLEIDKRLEAATRLLSETDFIHRRGTGSTGIIASGAPAAVCADVLRDQGLEDQVSLLSVGVVFPLLEQRFIDFLTQMERVLVLEELTPYLEDSLLALCNRHGIKTTILGKRSGHLPVPFEYEPHVIREGLHGALGLGTPIETRPPPEVPPRPPILCPGCPHRSAYFAARAVFGEDQLYFNDIGCYTLGYGPPLDTADALLCMGAGISLAAGVARVSGQRTVGFIGDSTFFHSGMTPLLNAIKENVSMVAVILDNAVTAMTGFQESPTVAIENEQATRRISIESVVRGLGCQQVEAVDPFDLPATAAAFTRARDAEGVSVVIIERSCPTFMLREIGRREWPTIPYEIDHARCQSCGRNPCGMQCSVVRTTGYQRHMARTRAMERTRTEPVAPLAPCSTQCPLFLCIQGYVGHVAAGEYREALEHILDRNPLAETVCRVCDRPCEPVCVRRSLDEPVAINDLKRFVVDWAARQQTYPYAPQREEDHGRRVAIVGAGPSGLAAAHDLRLRGYQVTLFDANARPGGLLLTGIPPFRLPREALSRDVERILSLGVVFRGNMVLGQNLHLSDLLDQGYDAIYLAIGAHQGIRLGLAGEEGTGAPAVVDALAYLRGVHLENNMQTGPRVVVVGGGNAAIDAARTTRRQGAGQVTIAYRRRRQEMPAIAEEVEAAEAEGVVLKTQLQPLSIFRGRSPGLECIRTEPGEPDASGRQRPVPVGGSEILLEADMIIAAIGQAPEPRAFPDSDIALSWRADGTLEVDPETGQTSHPRIFAGGDLTEARQRTVTWAMACGQRAAWAIDRGLRGAEQADRRPPPPRPRPPHDGEWPGIEREDRAARQHPSELSPSSRMASYDEVVAPLTEQQAQAEAARCLVCGLCANCRSCIDLFGCPAFFVADEGVQIDPAICTGCGVCAAFCPNNAIRSKQEPKP